jgi:2,3-dihydroxybenzoate decarboxylase
MASKRNVQIIAIEEHFSDHEVIETLGMKQPPAMAERLGDLGEKRLEAMDAAGVDVQVLSLNAPGTQQCDRQTSVRLARGVNDRLAQAIKANPDRFSGFASLPTPDPLVAADELSRAVNELGLKGAMVHGLTNGEFLDERKFWPVFERAQQLDVPIYIHPAIPDKTVASRYYETYAKDFPRILSAGWGYTVEAATQGVRLVLSGVFDAYPDLKIIIGHLGEGLPFLLRRMDEAFSRAGNNPLSFRDTFCSHFYITTSGNFSDPALQCTLSEMGADRVLFAIDYPFVMNEPGVEWIEQVMLSEEDRTKILSGNAQRLLRL